MLLQMKKLNFWGRVAFHHKLRGPVLLTSIGFSQKKNKQDIYSFTCFDICWLTRTSLAVYENFRNVLHNIISIDKVK